MSWGSEGRAMTTSRLYTKKVLCRSFCGKLKKKKGKEKGVGVASPQKSARERSGQSLSFSTPLSKEQHEACALPLNIVSCINFNLSIKCSQLLWNVFQTFLALFQPLFMTVTDYNILQQKLKKHNTFPQASTNGKRRMEGMWPWVSYRSST